MGKNKKYKTTVPVFRLKPVPRTNQCIVQHVAYFNEGDRLHDEIIDIETTETMTQVYGKNIYYVGNIDGYDITARITKCNMLGGFLLSNGKLPVYNLCFSYNKTLVKGYLFNVYINFTIDPSCRESLKSPSAYVNAKLSGKFSMDFDCDKSVLEKRADIIQSTLDGTLEKIVAKYMFEEKQLDKYSEEISNVFEKESDSIKTFFNRLFDGLPIANFPSDKIILNVYLGPLYKSKYISELLRTALVEREKERRSELGIDEDFYTFPENLINFVKKDKPIVVDS
jgi:hypothetical protein